MMIPVSMLLSPDTNIYYENLVYNKQDLPNETKKFKYDNH